MGSALNKEHPQPNIDSLFRGISLSAIAQKIGIGMAKISQLKKSYESIAQIVGKNKIWNTPKTSKISIFL